MDGWTQPNKCAAYLTHTILDQNQRPPLSPVDKISKVCRIVLHIILCYSDRLSTPPPQIPSIVEILKNHTLPRQPRLDLFPHRGSRAKIPVVDLGIGRSQVFLL